MSSAEMASLASCLQLPTNFILTSVTATTGSLLLEVRCQDRCAACPACGELAERIHSHYVRTVADVPCDGQRVVLHLRVRKFVCPSAHCPRYIFTERLPELVQPYARMTIRLIELLQAIGLVAGGEQGTRLAAKVGIHTSPPTLLTHLLALPLSEPIQVRVLGVDDWCWKKRFRYGTILVDLEHHKIIEVLPDRTADTFAAFLRQHPEVEVITRDRGHDYAAAAREAAPQAKQVVDRFHLMRNLAEVLAPLLARTRSEWSREDREEAPLPPAQIPSLPTPETWQQRTAAVVGRRHEAGQAARDARYQQMLVLRERGLTQRQIATRLGMSERSVRVWLKRGSAPTCTRSFRRRSIFDPYAAYVLSRWQAGEREGTRLYEEIRAQGFPGKVRVVQTFLATLRHVEQDASAPPPATPVEGLSANQATWLFLRRPEELSPQEQEQVAFICQHSSVAQHTYELTQAFVSMLRERRGQDFSAWTQAVAASKIGEMERFARGLLHDRDAVIAGLTDPYSNGPVEAHVQKLKVIKRQMYGRAKLPLLRQRLLHAV